MKALLWIGGFCGALAGVLVYTHRDQPTQRPIDRLAHNLEAAWADHHTTV